MDIEILKQKVEEALNEIRPAIQMDGGDVELVDIVDNIVYVEMQGHCDGCPSATMTLKAGIERIIMDKVPEIIRVESV